MGIFQPVYWRVELETRAKCTSLWLHLALHSPCIHAKGIAWPAYAAKGSGALKGLQLNWPVQVLQGVFLDLEI